jgi:putative spermidine/putrescine transport system ATP-binding protein
VAGFLGKTNVLPARLERDGSEAVLRVADGRWPAAAMAGGRVTVSVRPERIGFASGPEGVGGTVRTRIFQGHHWLYEVETAAGTVTVIRQNSGEAAPGEGDEVRLTWRPEDMVVHAEAP